MKTRLIIFFLLISLQINAQSFWEKYIDCGYIQCTDPENDEIYWTITAGNTSKYFAITPCSGIVKVDTIAYNSFVYQKTWTLTFKCTDTVGNYSLTKRKIILKKVNGIRQTPIISNAL